jgi:hypothetical protein
VVVVCSGGGLQWWWFASEVLEHLVLVLERLTLVYK